MAELKQGDQLEPTYSSYMRIWDIAMRTCQKRLTIGRSGERGSGISVLVARHDEEDDEMELVKLMLGLSRQRLVIIIFGHVLYIYIYIYIYSRRFGLDGKENMYKCMRLPTRRGI